MQWFVVKYRNSDGTMTEAEFEAADKSALFKLLAEKNVSAVSIAHGRLSKKSASYPIRGLVMGVFFIAVAVVACLFYFCCGGKNLTNSATNDTSCQVSAKQGKASTPRKMSRAQKVQEIKAELNDTVKEFIKKADTNNVIRLGAPQLDPNDPDNAIRTQTMTEVAMLIGIEPGDPMPPVPFSFMLDDDVAKEAARSGTPTELGDGGNKRFLEELEKWRITIKETDSDKRAAKKQELFDAQLELINGIEEGVSVNDSIRAAYNFRKKAYEIRNNLTMAIIELHESDPDESITKGMIDKAHGTLVAEGIKKINYLEVMPEYADSEENNTQEEADE